MKFKLKTYYSQIDLKNCEVKIREGSVFIGAVNNALGYVLGDTTMTVDAFVGEEVKVGQEFRVVGSTAIHRVTARTFGGGNTTSLTFTPGLTGAVADNAVITTFGISVHMKIGQGNLTWSRKKTVEYTLDRGILDEVREGDQVPMDVKLDLTWEFLYSDTGEEITPYEALTQENAASAFVSSDSDTCRPYAVDIVVVYIPQCSSGSTKGEIYTFPDFRQEQIDGDFKAGTLSVSGKCNALKPTIERTDQTNLA